VSRLVGSVVHALDEVDSTQTVLARLAGEGAPEGAVVTARHQTRGRGRHDRRWWDSPGDAVLLSVLLKPPIPVRSAPQLSLVAAVAVADALEAAAAVDSRIRWPNDVLVSGRKICGILPDAMSVGPGRVGRIILGVGINVNQIAFPSDLQADATSLRLVTGRPHDTSVLQSIVLDTLDRRYREWLDGGFGPLRGEWRRRSSTLGQRIRTAAGHEGVAVDLADDGALLVEAGDGVIRRVVSGSPGAVSGAEERGDAARH